MRLVLAVCSFFERGDRTVVGDVKVENRIGDAIVHRAIRAHQEGTPWKCCIVIPVIPGFPFPIDHSDASAVRTFLSGTFCHVNLLALDPYYCGVSESDDMQGTKLHLW